MKNHEFEKMLDELFIEMFAPEPVADSTYEVELELQGVTIRTDIDKLPKLIQTLQAMSQ